jgi:hypothetical protein
MSDHPTEMHELAMAALYIPELARGVVGAVNIEMDGMTCQESWRKTRDEIFAAQRTLVDAGWRRNERLEDIAPYDRHNIDIAVYEREFDSGMRWIVVTAANRFGLSSTFTGVKEKPW